MKRIIFILTLMIMTGFAGTDVFALTVTAKPVSSGVYEDGKFTPGEDGLEATYVIDEAEGTVKLEKVIESNREGRVEEGALYEITNTLVSEGISALLVSKNKKGQKIITAVREAGLGASEIIIFGNDFYEYCRASNGKFYLEYGEVKQGRL